MYVGKVPPSELEKMCQQVLGKKGSNVTKTTTKIHSFDKSNLHLLLMAGANPANESTATTPVLQ
jgi:hypothetical protein